VREEFLSFEAVQQVLPSLISSGVVAEIDEATYFAATQVPDEPAWHPQCTAETDCPATADDVACHATEAVAGRKL